MLLLCRWFPNLKKLRVGCQNMEHMSWLLEGKLVLDPPRPLTLDLIEDLDKSMVTLDLKEGKAECSQMVLKALPQFSKLLLAGTLQHLTLLELHDDDIQRVKNIFDANMTLTSLAIHLSKDLLQQIQQFEDLALGRQNSFLIELWDPSTTYTKHSPGKCIYGSVAMMYIESWSKLHIGSGFSYYYSTRLREQEILNAASRLKAVDLNIMKNRKEREKITSSALTFLPPVVAEHTLTDEIRRSITGNHSGDPTSAADTDFESEEPE
ncbi:hypothetical protein BGX26_010035 [Mortierella sp. AD094]|nr:hypothetical protein BGX26_010035 [Mortierella sp. AD094]